MPYASSPSDAVNSRDSLAASDSAASLVRAILAEITRDDGLPSQETLSISLSVALNAHDVKVSITTSPRVAMPGTESANSTGRPSSTKGAASSDLFIATDTELLRFGWDAERGAYVKTWSQPLGGG